MADRIKKMNIGSRNAVHNVILSGLGSNSTLRSIDVNRSGLIYGVDTSRHMLLKIFEDGRVLGAMDGHVSTSGDAVARGLLGSAGNDARLSSPVGLCVDASGNVYFGDQTSTKIKVADTQGRCVDFLGAGFVGDSVANNGQAVQFRGSGLGLAVDVAGRLYVVDQGNHKVKRAETSGKTVLLAGTGAAGAVNANGQTASFSSPQDCCVDNAGNVYVADTANNRIRRIDPSGTVIALCGSTPTGSADGQGDAARFNSPRRICCSRDGRLIFVLDHGNQAIRLVTPNGKVTTFCHYQPTDTGTGDVCIDESGFLYVLENNGG